MATGNPKAKWIGENLLPLAAGIPQVDVTLNYEGKLPIDDIIVFGALQDFWEAKGSHVRHRLCIR